ncbi:hypothetical protein B0H16DRAFT_1476557 [Mycena metata]|uniref:Uncharacterized protein n=1 Tax=Mycena metata TaxID=1033252 RepID=A0AAD7HC31_9AGAR|nr:hypothetical protein B0H16DRAFT_1476557 [Mycena metata]
MPKDTQTSQALTAEQKKLLDGLAAAEKYLDSYADKSSPSSREFTQHAKAHVSIMYDRTKSKFQKSTMQPYNKSLKKAEAHLGSILHQASLPLFTPEAWLDNLEASHAGSMHAEREDAAIISAKLLMNSTNLKNRINTNRAHSTLPIEERLTAWQNFGPVLLMDPYWSVDVFIPGHCSREFPILIKLLLDSMPCDPDDENTTLIKGCYRDSCKVLMGVLTAFDMDFALFVNEFLRQHRTTVYVAATKA